MNILNKNQLKGFDISNNIATFRNPVDTIQAVGRDINFAESKTGYSLYSLYNFIGNVATDTIGNSNALEANGANTSISTELLTFNGAETFARVLNLTSGISKFSLMAKIKYDTMDKSPFTIMALSSNTNATGFNDEFIIRRSFGNIQCRVRSSTGNDMPLFETIADVSTIEGNGYFNFWIVRNFNKITFSISDGQNFETNFTYDAGTINNDAVHLILNEPIISNADILAGDVERIAVFTEPYKAEARLEIEQISGKSGQNDFETAYALNSSRDLNLNGNRILNVSQPNVAGDVATKSYVDSAVGTTGGATQLIDSEDNVIINTAGGNVDVSNKKITGVLIPEDGTDVANKNYVENYRYKEIKTANGDASLKVSQMTNDFGGTEKYNTLETGVQNSGRFALSNGGKVKLSFGETGFSFNGNGTGTAGNPDGYFYWDASDSTYNIRIKEDETEFGKPIEGQLAKGRALLENEASNNSLVSNMSSYIFESGADFGIVNRSLGGTASLFLGSTGLSSGIGQLAGVKNAIIHDDLDSWWRGHMCFCNNIETGSESYGSNVNKDDHTRIRIRGNDAITDMYDEVRFSEPITGATTNELLIDTSSGRFRFTESNGDCYLQSQVGGSYAPLRLGAGLNSAGSRLDINSGSTISKQNIDMNNDNRIINCQDPTGEQHVATKNYVDTQLNLLPAPSGRRFKTVYVNFDATTDGQEGDGSGSILVSKLNTGKYRINYNADTVRGLYILQDVQVLRWGYVEHLPKSGTTERYTITILRENGTESDASFTFTLFDS